MKFCLLIVVMGGVFCSGCATIASKSDYPVLISSNPSGAEVTIKDGKGMHVAHVTTPDTITLKSSAGYFKPAQYTFSFSKQGYESTTRQMSATLDNWYLGNIILGGLIGMIVIDPLSGAMFKLDGQVEERLLSSFGSAPAPKSARNPSRDQDPLRYANYPHKGSTAAILTFDARAGLSADEVALLTDRFAVELDRSETYSMVPRNRMKEILEIHAYSVVCSSVDCAVEAGQQLGVEYAIYGSIGRIGSMFTMNVYIAGVEKGVVVAGTTMDYQGEIEGLLTEGMSQTANGLLQAVSDKLARKGELPLGKNIQPD